MRVKHALPSSLPFAAFIQRSVVGVTASLRNGSLAPSVPFVTPTTHRLLAPVTYFNESDGSSFSLGAYLVGTDIRVNAFMFPNNAGLMVRPSSLLVSSRLVDLELQQPGGEASRAARCSPTL